MDAVRLIGIVAPGEGMMRRVAGASLLIIALGGGHLVSTLMTVGNAPPPVAEMPVVVPVFPAAPTSDVPPVAGPPRSFARDPLGFLSTASADSLALLPGIGPVLAGRLIVARRTHGRFRAWTDVDRVTGIGPRTLARLKAAASVR